jgi:cysteine protease ATG4
LFTFPQSVGIAGGRPSSSYYFVASQANSLFYLDPHITRPAIPLEVPPAPASNGSQAKTDELGEEPVAVNRSAGVAYTLDVVDVDNVSDDSDSDASTASAKRRSTLKSSPQAKRLSAHAAGGSLRLKDVTSSKPIPPPSPAADPFTASPKSVHPMDMPDALPVDPTTTWYANAYPEAALKTFHCDKVKKMPLSGLDPSMLLGFLIRNQADFDDFCDRVKGVSPLLDLLANEANGPAAAEDLHGAR